MGNYLDPPHKEPRDVHVALAAVKEDVVFKTWRIRPLPVP